MYSSLLELTIDNGYWMDGGREKTDSAYKKEDKNAQWVVKYFIQLASTYLSSNWWVNARLRLYEALNGWVPAIIVKSRDYFRVCP